jgi:hypothetical protein
MYLHFPLILFHLVLTWAVEFLKRSRRARDEELNDLYSSPNILRVIKSRIMTYAGHVARMGRGEVHTEFWRGNHFEDPDLDGRTILRWIFGKWDGDMDWVDLAQDRDRWRVSVIEVMNI